MTDGATLLIRADASTEMGTGHVMRSLALAQAWQDEGGKAGYAATSCPAGVEERLLQENIEVARLLTQPGSMEDARATAEIARAWGACWVVLDGYQFGGDYQQALKCEDLNLLALDDFGHAQHYWVDVVLNQDLNAEEGLYRSREPYTRLLLGPDYVCLRREFRRGPRPPRKPAGRARKLLVTMGGSDPGNVTLQVLRALAECGFRQLETIVLVGPGNVHGASLEDEARRHGAAVRLLHNPPNIPELMAWCDAAITAGGSTLWELACFAVPSLVVIIAKNQRLSTELLENRGACRVLRDANQSRTSLWAKAIAEFAADDRGRAALSEQIGRIVDGRGADRVCEVILGSRAQVTLPKSSRCT